VCVLCVCVCVCVCLCRQLQEYWKWCKSNDVTYSPLNPSGGFNAPITVSMAVDNSKGRCGCVGVHVRVSVRVCFAHLVDRRAGAALAVRMFCGHVL
jgi:hypothetical protein